MTASQRKAFHAFFDALPGHRGRDIPADIYDQIAPVANGISQPTWGRPATLEQLQYLHDNGHHTPAAIHEQFGAMPHPHAPSLNLSEYQTYSRAMAVHQHTMDPHAGAPPKPKGQQQQPGQQQQQGQPQGGPR